MAKASKRAGLTRAQQAAFLKFAAQMLRSKNLTVHVEHGTLEQEVPGSPFPVFVSDGSASLSIEVPPGTLPFKKGRARGAKRV